MMLRVLCSLFLLVLAARGQVVAPDTRLCVVGITEDWDSTLVTLTLHQRSDQGWSVVGDPWSGRLGRTGLVWGLGLHPLPKGAVVKREGDGKSPAGVFAIGGVWGYDRSVRKFPNMPYRRITARDLWVEDVNSPSYNRHLVLDHDPHSEWEKKQQMKQGEYAHSLKLFIAHNAPPKVVKGAGSAIFFHIWRDGGSKVTAGCTTMAEDKLRWLIARIDPAAKPVYVLLPKVEYDKRRKEWGLP